MVKMVNLKTSLFLLLCVSSFCNSQKWNITFDEPETKMMIEETVILKFTITGPNSEKPQIAYKNSENKLLTVSQPVIEKKNDNVWKGKINVTSIFLGRTTVSVSLVDSTTATTKIVILRPPRVIDHIFTGSITVLCMILYINFGCAMDWNLCYKTIKKPTGPSIGLLCQYLFMPATSYLIGYLLFPRNAEMRLAIFFTGISPTGKAANVWTVFLGGNLNLSITITTFDTLLAFATIPCWLFTLGRHIFEKANLGVPYKNIAYFSFGLLIPLAVGFLIQKKFPKLCRIMVRIMKPLATILIAFIVVFAIATNLYLFRLFSWQIVVAGLSLPWSGYIFGYLVAWIFRQPTPNIRTISIVTGARNTGIAILIIKLSLPQPEADLATVAPVAVAIMEMFPLAVCYIIKRCTERCKKSETSIEDLQVSQQPVNKIIGSI